MSVHAARRREHYFLTLTSDGTERSSQRGARLLSIGVPRHRNEVWFEGYGREAKHVQIHVVMSARTAAVDQPRLWSEFRFREQRLSADAT